LAFKELTVIEDVVKVDPNIEEKRVDPAFKERMYVVDAVTVDPIMVENAV